MDRDAICDMDSGGSKELCIRCGPNLPTGRVTFEGDDVSIFLHAAKHRSQWPSDFGISLYAVDQHSDWLAAEVVECHIKFSQRKICM